MALLLVACSDVSPQTRPTANITKAPPPATASPSSSPVVTLVTREVGDLPVTAVRPSNPLEDAQLLDESEHFLFYGKSDEAAVIVGRLVPAVESILAAVSARLDSNYDGQIALLVDEPPDRECPARGLTGRSDVGAEQLSIIVVYADSQTSRAQLEAVVGHEIGHILHFDGAFGGATSNHLLDEGLASWAAGDYWAEWFGADVDETVRSYRREGRFIPLTEHPALQVVYQDLVDNRRDCLERRDILYNEAASFLGFLIDEYGKDNLRALMADARERLANELPPLPDYEQVYGLGLGTLEELWLEQLGKEDTRLYSHSHKPSEVGCSD